MSAPDTNTDKQERAHRPALLGIKAAIAFGLLMLLGVLGYNAINAGDGAAVSNATPGAAQSEAAPTDVYEPGTNNADTETADD